MHFFLCVVPPDRARVWRFSRPLFRTQTPIFSLVRWGFGELAGNILDNGVKSHPSLKSSLPAADILAAPVGESLDFLRSLLDFP